MDCELLGWPDAGPTLALDHERFAYAGKFRMSNTGKAVGWAPGETGGRISGETGGQSPGEDGPGELLAAAAFNADRTDDRVCWIRYITVRADRRGDGLGPELARFVVEAATAAGPTDEPRFDSVRIAVNNAYAFEAMYRAGFAYTGETTGLAELVLSTDEAPTDEGYREGMSRYAGRDAPGAAYAETRANGEPPARR